MTCMSEGLISGALSSVVANPDLLADKVLKDHKGGPPLPQSVGSQG